MFFILRRSRPRRRRREPIQIHITLVRHLRMEVGDVGGSNEYIVFIVIQIDKFYTAHNLNIVIKHKCLRAEKNLNRKRWNPSERVANAD